MKRFNLRKLNELEVKEQYQIEITNRFAALEDLDVNGCPTNAPRPFIAASYERTKKFKCPVP